MSDIADEENIERLKDIAKRSGVPWQFIHGSAPQEMLDNPSAYNWDGTLKEVIMPEDPSENEHIERLKEQAKMIGLPWQYMHGSGPPEMMEKPHRYNWDGTLKPPPEEPCEWCGRFGDDCYCGTDKRHYGEHDYGNMLIGTVKSVESVTRCVVLSNCISSAGTGVGYALDPAIDLSVVMKPRIKLPVSGSVIGVRTPHEIESGQYRKCWWILESAGEEKRMIETVVGVVGGCGLGSGTEYLIWMDNSHKVSETGEILYPLGGCKIYLVDGLKPPEQGTVAYFTGEVFTRPLEPNESFGMRDATWKPQTENPKMSEQKIDATVAFTFPDGIQGLALLQLVNADGTPLTESQIELTIKNIASAIQYGGAKIHHEMTGPGDQR